MEAGTRPGLRERKKARTRREISDVATRLFMEHGFEEVTLAQIADAAEVSVKTIFNHFGSKEELYFDRIGEMRVGLTVTVAGRPAGMTVLGALRALLTDNVVPFPGRGWSFGSDDGLERFRGFLATQDRSPALISRRLLLADQLRADLREELAAALDRRPDDPALLALAAGISSVMAVRDEVLRAGFAERLTPRTIRKRVTAFVDEAFDRLERAFGDIDRAA